MSKEIIVLIGVAGSGKSTIRAELLAQHPDYKVYSIDDLRAAFFAKRNARHGNASEAFAYASAHDREYEQYTKTYLANLLKSGVGIIADSTNLSPKRRMKYVNAKYTYGYDLKAIVVNTPLQECLDRQAGRGDKAVPEEAVRDQYSKLDLSDLRRYYSDVKWIPNDSGMEKIRNIVAGPDFNLYNPAQLRDWVNSNLALVSVRRTQIYPDLRVLKYTRECMFRNLWDYAAIEMRGLVVDNDWNVVVHPFTKLAAEGEVLGILPAVVFEDNTVVQWSRKINGFMAAVTLHPQRGVLFSTTGSMDSNFVTMMRKHLGFNIPFGTTRATTYLYEICDSSDPHIVAEEPGATMLAVREHGKSEELWAPKSSSVGDLRPLLNTCRHEGFVAKDPATGRLIKLKSRYYTLIKWIGRTEPQNVNRIICDTDALVHKFGADLAPLYEMFKKGTPLNAALTSAAPESQRVWALRQAVDQVYSQLGYK